MVVRGLILPPFTEGKLKTLNRVSSFAATHNQSDVGFVLKCLLAAIVLSVVAYVYLR